MLGVSSHPAPFFARYSHTHCSQLEVLFVCLLQREREKSQLPLVSHLDRVLFPDLSLWGIVRDSLPSQWGLPMPGFCTWFPLSTLSCLPFIFEISWASGSTRAPLIVYCTIMDLYLRPAFLYLWFGVGEGDRVHWCLDSVAPEKLSVVLTLLAWLSIEFLSHSDFLSKLCRTLLHCTTTVTK